MVKFLNENTQWVHKKIQMHNQKGSNPYWHQLSLIYDQLQGLEKGYLAKAAGKKNKIPLGSIHKPRDQLGC